jgi:hypothetical protein
VRVFKANCRHAPLIANGERQPTARVGLEEPVLHMLRGSSTCLRKQGVSLTELSTELWWLNCSEELADRESRGDHSERRPLDARM